MSNGELDKGLEVADFITQLLNSSEEEAHDLLVNYGEVMEEKARSNAAALDLLEALESIIPFMDDYTTGIRDLLPKAEKAIAKARGEQT